MKGDDELYNDKCYRSNEPLCVMCGKTDCDLVRRSSDGFHFCLDCWAGIKGLGPTIDEGLEEVQRRTLCQLNLIDV